MRQGYWKIDCRFLYLSYLNYKEDFKNEENEYQGKVRHKNMVQDPYAPA